MNSGKNPAPIKPTITLELLEKLDLRVGTIDRVDEVKRSDKLGYADGLTPVLAVPEKEIPNGSRAG